MCTCLSALSDQSLRSSHEVANLKAPSADSDHKARTFGGRTYPKVRFLANDADFLFFFFIIGIKHGFSCINICQVPWEVLKT